MTQGLASYAEIAVPVAVHGTFTYTIPDPLRDSVRLGSRVEVEIGSKLTTGFVVGFNDTTETTRLKPVRSVLDEDEPPLLPEIIQLCKWAAQYYIAPLGEMLRVALPANMGARGKREATLVGSDEIMLRARRGRAGPTPASSSCATACRMPRASASTASRFSRPKREP
jgi:primosomal protein N'